MSSTVFDPAAMLSSGADIGAERTLTAMARSPRAIRNCFIVVFVEIEYLVLKLTGCEASDSDSQSESRSTYISDIAPSATYFEHACGA
jgi:hypothetical protein